MKPGLLSHWKPPAGVLLTLALLLAGCAPSPYGPSVIPTTQAPPVLASGPQRVVEAYLQAASRGEGSQMYGLLASSERDNETPETLQKTAQDRYFPETKWDVLKTEENGGSATVVVDFKGAKVDPNPTKFALTRESGEWRIVDSPELHEREKNGRIRIKL